MYYLGLALYAEGPTDYYFLPPVLHRLCSEICAQEALRQVDFSEVLYLDHPAAVNDQPREARIVEAARQAFGAWRIIFIHADGGSDPHRAHSQQIQPALDALQREFDGQGYGVAVVPIRESEAWALCDGNALRQVFGASISDSDMGLPTSPAGVESARDPKAVLEAAFQATEPTGRRKRQGVSPMLNALGQQVSLSQLRQVPSFAALETEVRQVLRSLRVLR